MLCSICGKKQTNNSDCVCDFCKASIIWIENIPPTFENFT